MTTCRAVDSFKTAFDEIDIAKFRREAFEPGRPYLLESYTAGEGPRPSRFPASSKWFAHHEGDRPSDGYTAFSPYMSRFAHHLVPYELSRSHIPDEVDSGSDALDRFLQWLAASPDPMDAVLAGILQSAIQPPDGADARFSMFEAPLLLLLKANEFNRLHDRPRLRQLYVAQSQLSDLPEELQHDLPTPRIVQEAGKGDVYSSSIWMGLEPTFTPLHRDPNPNLFCQLLGDKSVRLLPPAAGDKLYREVQTRLGKSGSSRLRGFEMMEGPERVMLNAATWGADPPKDVIEAELVPGDALFIPKGWWHSFKSTRLDGRLNVSVNWWFR